MKYRRMNKKAYLLGWRTHADTLWQRVVVVKSWGCGWPSSPPKLSGVSTVVVDARARGGHHGMGAVIVMFEVAGARKPLPGKSWAWD